jgi:RHS repeat-associated protein
VYYFHTDHLNTPRVVTDTAGNLRWRWLAEPFGTTAPETNPSNLGVFTQPLRFPGQYADQESGLYYNHWRYFDPTEGRYVSSDPIGLRGGINTFAYTLNNPLSFTDALGLDVCTTVLNLGVVIVQQCTTSPPIPGRPPNLPPKEDRYYDRHCKGSSDPCGALKAATMTAIADAKVKMENMLSDPYNLSQFAFFEPNPAATGTSTTWTGHADDLDGRRGAIWSMIALGRKMGCDMSAETAAALTLYTPGAPR